MTSTEIELTKVYEDPELDKDVKAHMRTIYRTGLNKMKETETAIVEARKNGGELKRLIKRRQAGVAFLKSLRLSGMRMTHASLDDKKEMAYYGREKFIKYFWEYLTQEHYGRNTCGVSAKQRVHQG